MLSIIYYFVFNIFIGDYIKYSCIVPADASFQVYRDNFIFFVKVFYYFRYFLFCFIIVIRLFYVKNKFFRWLIKKICYFA
ncbi:membrane protein [Candidatus Omnitrophus magneticus]|uniref:Membrane protein n=1 Tax=Candidatus Omnitrophus magneticus TaxID=1609969 RepID=A0A0F0CNH8_9BACT|nr:membrane protein [Candidatus Omnitrophus magneticus]